VSSSDAVRVTRLLTTPVKGMRISEVAEISLGVTGAAGDRAFCVVDERGRMANGKVVRELQTAAAEFEPASGALGLSFSDGSSVSSVVEYGPVESIRFFSTECPARPLVGPWNEALSSAFGRSLRLVALESAGADRGPEGAASLVSQASLRRLAEEAGLESVDPRRFRMLIEVDGLQAHEEDGWVGRSVRVGGAVVRFRGHVGRCLITSRDAETAEVTLRTLDLLAGYRGDLGSTEPLPFGVYGSVLTAGAVRVGDAVTVDPG
jgi:uncharacterized protein YcbX